MDLKEIRKIEKVVDRLAAIGPSGVSPPHCWFCGKVEAWLQCDCPGARDAQQGKRPKPRWDHRRNCIILDEALIAANEKLGYKRYRQAVHKPPKPVHAPLGVDIVDTDPVHAELSPVHAVHDPVHAAQSEPSNGGASRKAYKAAHERERRAKRKAGP